MTHRLLVRGEVRLDAYNHEVDSVLHQMPDGINAMSYGDTRT